MSEDGQVIIVCSYREEEKLWEKAESGSYSQFPPTELHRMMPERSLQLNSEKAVVYWKVTQLSVLNYRKTAWTTVTYILHKHVPFLFTW